MFLVLGLPRSRTFWLSEFLTYGEYHCGHEEIRHLRTLEDVNLWLTQEYAGSAETAAAPFWRLIPPEVKVVVVRRPVAEVVRSVIAQDLSGICEISEDVLRRNMQRLDAKLQQIAKRLPNVLSVNFHDLNRLETAKAVWEHCLPYPFDVEWWDELKGTNLQCDLRALMRYLRDFQEPVRRTTKIVAAYTRGKIAARPPRSPDGVTFQQETFDTWLRDAQLLAAEHCVVVGEAPDNWQNKDLPLIKRMYDGGFLQITTARANGRMFGYLMALINPSLEARGEFTGFHCTFYVSKDMPGIGVKLQRASIAALKARGVQQALFYAGVRGDGPRMGALYRRLGAQEFGSLYRLELGAE